MNSALGIKQEKNHTLILGWSERIFPLISEIAASQKNVSNKVTIFADQDPAKMKELVAKYVANLARTRITYLKGNPIHFAELSSIDLSDIASVITIDSDSEDGAETIGALLAIKARDPESQRHIVAELNNENNKVALSHLHGNSLKIIHSNEIAARVLAQSIRQPGFAAAINSFLSFKNTQLYTQEVSQLLGWQYQAAVSSFEKASVIGIKTTEDEIHLNPEPGYLINKGDQIIAIAESADEIIYTGVRDHIASVKPRKITTKPQVKKAAHYLFIGFSSITKSVIDEIVPQLSRGSSIQVLADPALFNRKLITSKQLKGVTIKFTPQAEDVATLTKVAMSRDFDGITVFSYRQGLSKSKADAQTLKTILILKKLFANKKGNSHAPRISAEILDTRKERSAQISGVDDLVVIDDLTSLLTAQTSVNTDLVPIFDQLFGNNGSKIKMLSVSDYVEVGKEFTYARMVAAAAVRGESVIGYGTFKSGLTSAEEKIVINPPKSAIYFTNPNDKLIVVS